METVGGTIAVIQLVALLSGLAKDVKDTYKDYKNAETRHSALLSQLEHTKNVSPPTRTGDIRTLEG